MQLALANLINRPIVYKMIRFDSADVATRQVVETVYINALEDAEAAAGADWAAGKAIGIACREFQAGDIVERDDGKISVRTGVGSGVIFDATEYTGTLPTITVDPTILAAIQYKPNQPKIQSIVDGEITWQ
jgi:hypothetical protein